MTTTDGADFASDYLPEIRAALGAMVARGLFDAPVTVVAGDRVQVRLDGPSGDLVILAYYDAEDDWVRLISAVRELDAKLTAPEELLRAGALPPPLRFCVANGWVAVRGDALREQVAPGHFRKVLEALARALPEVHARWGGAKPGDR